MLKYNKWINNIVLLWLQVSNKNELEVTDIKTNVGWYVHCYFKIKVH